MSYRRAPFTLAFTSDLILIVGGLSRNILPINKGNGHLISHSPLYCKHMVERTDRISVNHWHTWSLAWEGVPYMMTFVLDLPSSRSFSHEFAIKVLRYGTSCGVRSTACTVLEGFFTCLARNYLWPWPISSRLISCDMANFMDIHIGTVTTHEGTMCHMPCPGQ